MGIFHYRNNRSSTSSDSPDTGPTDICRNRGNRTYILEFTFGLFKKGCTSVATTAVRIGSIYRLDIARNRHSVPAHVTDDAAQLSPLTIWQKEISATEPIKLEIFILKDQSEALPIL